MTEAMISPEALQSWLVERVATYGEIAPDDFTVQTPLIELGFNSVYALTLCGDIEDTFGIEADPSLVWDNSTIEELSAALNRILVK